jgi:hypothetical protein
MMGDPFPPNKESGHLECASTQCGYLVHHWVTPSGHYAVTGKVKLWDGATAIGSAMLNGGVATLKKSTLIVGTHAITAQYLSDAYNDKSTSSVVNQVVQ